jgi:hypothetical protein
VVPLDHPEELLPGVGVAILGTPRLAAHPAAAFVIVAAWNQVTRSENSACQTERREAG